MKLLPIFVSVAFCCNAAAQTSRGCDTVYQDAVAAVSIQDQREATADYYYGKYCESDGSLKTGSSQDDLKIGYGQLSLGASSANQTVEQRLSQFCSERHEQSVLNASSYDYNRAPVVDALKTYNECKAIELTTGGHLRVSNAVVDPSSIIIRADFDSEIDNVSLIGVTYDRDAGSCVLNGDGAKLTADFKERQMNRSFSVVCTRRPTVTKAKIKKFERFAVGVVLNQLTYTVTMPMEGLEGWDIAEANFKRYQDSVAQRSKALAERDALQTRITKHTEEIHLLSQHDGPLGSMWEALGCPQTGNGTIASYIQSVCGSRQSTTRVLGASSGGLCGVTYVAFTCSNL